MRRILVVVTLVAIGAISLSPAGAATVAADSRPGANATLHDYASGTWASFVAMTDSRSGLPADSLGIDGSRSIQTSTTNIAAYTWSSVVARGLEIIRRRELESRM